MSAYATRAVPRYTSYPTVPHFSDAVGEAEYRGWLAGLDPTQPISLYLHVPFCHQACWYCACNMKLVRRVEPVAAYTKALIAEINLLAEALPGRMQVSHIHFGGGTPTSLSPGQLAEIMDALSQHFRTDSGAEIAIEADPRTLSQDVIATIGTLRFTRASLGIQEFDPAVQTAINRVQPPRQVTACVDSLRKVGVRAINFDLIYGLPHQTSETLERTVELCADMAPDRMALFGYAHVPWMAKRQRMIDEAALPGLSERHTQMLAARAALVRHGYHAIGLDHFAKPNDPLAIAARRGTLRRNFQGYTTDTADTLLGIGATAIGRTPSGLVQSIPETGAWTRSIEAGRLPVAKGIGFSAEDRLRGAIIEDLMCRYVCDLAARETEFGFDQHWRGEPFEALAPMIEDGLVGFDGDVVSVTRDGRDLVRVIASAFDAYLAAGRARHSVAV